MEKNTEYHEKYGYSLSRVAFMLKKTQKEIKNYINNGNLQTEVVDGVLFIKKKVLEDFLNQQEKDV